MVTELNQTMPRWITKPQICEGSISLIQWKQRASWSASRICTCKNACLRSPQKATSLKRFWTSTLQSRFWNVGTVSRQSFNDGLVCSALADASKTFASLCSPLLLSLLAYEVSRTLFLHVAHQSPFPRSLHQVGLGLFCHTHPNDWVLSPVSSQG